MKQKLLKPLRLRVLMLVALLCAGFTSAWGDEVYYILEPVSTGQNAPHNAYASPTTTTISGIEWSVTGNSEMVPWRIGGKSITGTDRTVESKTAMGSAISKVELTVGAASSITVNSLKLIVASDKDFDNQIDVVSSNFIANSTITFIPTSGTEWANAYYKFVFNVTVSGDKNKFVEFTKAEFYSAVADNRTGVNMTGFTALSTTLVRGEETTTSVTNDQSGWEPSYTYSSSKESVATVDENGIITAVGKGTATITAALNIAASDENYKLGETTRKSIDITVNNPTHTATFSINGDVSTADIEEGEAIAFPTDITEIFGKQFVGWTTATIDGSTNERPATLITAATMGSDEVTYYAVFANKEGEEKIATLTANERFGTQYKPKEFTDDLGNTWSGVCNSSDPNSTGTIVYGLNSDASHYLVSPTFGNNITSVKVIAYNGSSTKNRYFYLKDDGKEVGSIFVAKSTQGKELIAELNGNEFRQFTMTASDALQFSSIIVSFGSTTYSDYCTTVLPPVAKIGETHYTTLQEAFNAANDGETVTLLKDYDATGESMAGGTRQFVINKSITFDGGGFTLTTKQCGIGIGNVNGDVAENIDVTIKNVTVLNTASGARCIDTRGKIGSLTLEGVTLNTQGAPSGYTQPLTIGGNQSDVANVTITNSTIQTNDNATAYYAIITFNPVNMTVTNSTIKGWANVYAKGQVGSAGSAGSVFNFNNCTLESSNAYFNTSNAFSAFTIEDNNVTINVTNSDIVITNTGDQLQSIAGYPMNNTLSGNKVTLGEGNKVKFVDNESCDFVINQSEGSEFTVTGGLFSTVVPDEFCAEGLTTVANTDEATKDEYPYAVGEAIELAAPTIFHDSGVYEGELKVAIAGEGTIMYTLNDGEAQTYSAPFTITEDATIKAWAVKDGVASDVTEPKTFTIKEKAKGAVVEDGYYTIQTNEGKYVNVAGRKTVTLVSDTKSAGTVIRVKAEEDGVKVLRSQGVDVPGYADKAMRYVPEIVKLVVDKLNNLGEGQLMGEAGLEALMNKFNEAFDEHLYLETVGENSYRIYGRTPSMQHVVDFYAENKQYIDPKLPMLEGKINAAIEKVLEKTHGSGASVLVPFSLETVWQNMDGTLTKPVDEASTMKFYEEVLTSETNVWNFAYHTAMIYWGKVKEHPRYDEFKGKLGDYAKYIDKVENIRPNFKYYIVQKDNKLDIISEGNGELNADFTAWTLTPRTDFSVAFNEDNMLNDKYYTTLYTDFAYTLPEGEGVKAYKVTEVSKAGVAVKVEMKGIIPAQTPVLLEADAADTKVLTLSTEDGTAPADNILVGADALINQYQIKTAQVEGLFNTAKDILGDSFYNTYIQKYEHLMARNAGTVNNKYFFGLDDADLDLCTYKLENGSYDCIVRSLSTGNEKVGFYNNWEAKANQAFLINEINPVKLFLKGDIDRDGDVDNNDLKALVEIVLEKVTVVNNPDDYDFDAAHVNEDEDINIADVTALVNILKPQPQD